MLVNGKRLDLTHQCLKTNSGTFVQKDDIKILQNKV